MTKLGEWGELEQQNERQAEPELFFCNVDEFVRELVIIVFSRKVGPGHSRGGSNLRWSAKWWESPEAIMRLEAMWTAWEKLSKDPSAGMSVWIRDHADHHMSVLFSQTGPFGESSDTSALGEPLPYEPPPADLFINEKRRP